jgi:D-alanine-D-alanine ligase
MAMPDWAHEYFERGYAQRWGLAAPSGRVRLEVDGIWNILQLSHTSRVVDIGCGHGRHALVLAERGADVVGVDFADSLLSRAQQLATVSPARVRWIRGDMRRVPVQSGCADAALIMDAFGFFETDEEDERVVREARRILRPRGSLLLKVVNGVPILTAFRDNEHERRDGVDVSVSNTLTMDPPRMTQRLRVSGNRGEGRYERRQRLYRAAELQALLERAGFSVTGILANTDGAPFESAQSGTIWMSGEAAHWTAT